MPDRLATGWREAELDETDRVLCEYTEKLTLNPASVGPADIERLRAAGLDDAGISSATQVIAYFNYINRIAEGLGVPFEDWLHPDGTRREA
jgi:uncharacterized peroxidase-related enzyme